jgi:hypothetical protein
VNAARRRSLELADVESAKLLQRYESVQPQCKMAHASDSPEVLRGRLDLIHKHLQDYQVLINQQNWKLRFLGIPVNYSTSTHRFCHFGCCLYITSLLTCFARAV